MKLNTIENRQAANLVTNSLTLFSQSEILKQIGHIRLPNSAPQHSITPALQHSASESPSTDPSIQKSNGTARHSTTLPRQRNAAAGPLHYSVPGDASAAAGLDFPLVEPWPDPVDGSALLSDIVHVLQRFVVLPKWGAETMALWILHTYAFHLRDVTTYIGLESPEKRCGKTTLITVLCDLVNRPLVAANISSSAFFRVIGESRPTLLIDEADTFLQGNDELRGILNSGYKKKTSFVVRVTSEPAFVPNRAPIPNSTTPKSSNSSPLNTENCALNTPQAQDSGPALSHSTTPSLQHPSSSRLARFSCWCPKLMAAIGRLPDTLADRCIVIRMQRKTAKEQCERLRSLDTQDLRRKCVRFVVDHADAISAAQPELPDGLNDRATDIWEPLFVLADQAGGDWPQLTRQAALALGSGASDPSPISTLLLDICRVFIVNAEQRMFSRRLVEELNSLSENRPWSERRNGKPITDIWLSQQLRPYSIRPRTIWIGNEQAKGYCLDDFNEAFDRYIPKVEARAYLDELRRPEIAPQSAERVQTNDLKAS